MTLVQQVLYRGRRLLRQSPEHGINGVAERWNGRMWSILPTPNPQSVKPKFADGTTDESPWECRAHQEHLHRPRVRGDGALEWRKWVVQQIIPRNSVVLDGSCGSATARLAVGQKTLDPGITTPSRFRRA